MTRPAPRATVKGIDVSYYQGQIDWQAARTTASSTPSSRLRRHGFQDPKFDRNWTSPSRRCPQRAYQFFRSNLDPIAQANLLINKVGQLEPGDLPPSSTSRAPRPERRHHPHQGRPLARSRRGRARRAAHRLHGPYFWRDSVGGPDFDDHRCGSPTTAPRARSSLPPGRSGRSISTHRRARERHRRNVDMNKFNGTRSSSRRWASAAAPWSRRPPGRRGPECAPIEPAGRIVDDGGACFRAGGDPRWLTRVTTAATAATSSPRGRPHRRRWRTTASGPSTCRRPAPTSSRSTSTRCAAPRARPLPHHPRRGTTTPSSTRTRRRASSPWAPTLRAGAGQKVRLNDNTGEAGSLNRDIVFDACASPASTTPRRAPPPAAASVPPRGVRHRSVLNVRPSPTPPRRRRHARRRQRRRPPRHRHRRTIQGNNTWHRITDAR